MMDNKNNIIPNNKITQSQGQPMPTPNQTTLSQTTPTTYQPSQDNSQTINPAMSNATGTNTNPVKDNKKKTLIICGIVGAIGLVVLIIVLLIIFLSGGNKTVSCTTHESSMGIDVDGETTVEITNGKLLSGSVRITANLSSLSERYADYEEEMVESLIERIKRRCDTDCKEEHNYAKGDHVDITLKYGPDGVEDLVYAYGIEEMSAQEIADKVQEEFEESEGTTCKQN